MAGLGDGFDAGGRLRHDRPAGGTYPLRLTPQCLIATDIVHGIPLAIFAGSRHLLIGNVNFGLLATCCLDRFRPS